LCEEVRVTSGVPKWGVFGPILFLAYLNDIWRNLESNIKSFTKGCIIQIGYKLSGDFAKKKKKKYIFTNTEHKYMILLPFEREMFAVS
jgi:hypothetical protein